MGIAFERKLNLLIGTPNMGDWKAKYGMSLCNMLTYLMATPVPGYREQRIKPMQVFGSIISRGRAQCWIEAQEKNYSHLLFIDADQRFPRDTAHRLLAADKDVIGCNIATKQYPATPTARRKGGIAGEPVYTDLDGPPLEKVWRLGCGIMLVSMRVLKTIGPENFEIRWVPELRDYRGEDWSLCQALDAAGFDIWVEHRLSNEVGHIGDFDYTHEFIGERKVVEVKQIGEA